MVHIAIAFMKCPIPSTNYHREEKIHIGDHICESENHGASNLDFIPSEKEWAL